MLGEKMGSMTATAVTKVLPTDGTLPKFEVTAQGSGTLAGIQVQICLLITQKQGLMEVCIGSAQMQCS